MQSYRPIFVTFVLLLSSIVYGERAIQELIQSSPPSRTVLEFLKALPLEFKNRPAFVYNSQSIQGASLEAPRTILTSANGRLVLAFNGDSRHIGFNKIEALEYSKKEAKFTFYEIDFANNRQEVSAPNPAKCLTCHRGPDPRPNWESYDHWPGVYASIDDRLAQSEVTPFLNFIRTASENPRYATLSLTAFLPVLNYTSFYGRLPSSPNITLTYELSRNNFERVARLISETPGYAVYKYLIAGSLGCYGQAFVPAGQEAIFQYYSKDTVREAEGLKNSVGEDSAFPGTLAFRSLFESRGIDVSDWFMNFKGALTNTFINGRPWEEQLLGALLERDASLNSYRYPGTTGDNVQLDCQKLSEKSEEILESRGTRFRRFETDPSAARAIWRRACLQCHGVPGPSHAPQFSFEEAIRRPNFRAWVESGKMPMGQRLTPSEKKLLLR